MNSDAASLEHLSSTAAAKTALVRRFGGAGRAVGSPGTGDWGPRSSPGQRSKVSAALRAPGAST